jgi:hypothetical protein
MRIAVDEKAIFGGGGKPSREAIETLRTLNRDHSLVIIADPERADAVLTELNRWGIIATAQRRSYDVLIDPDAVNQRSWGAIQTEIARRGKAKTQARCRTARPLGARNADLERMIDRLSREE